MGENSWGPRIIPDYELIYVVAGEFSYSTEKRRIIVKEGQILCIPPGERHIFKLEKNAAYGAVLNQPQRRTGKVYCRCSCNGLLDSIYCVAYSLRDYG